MLTGEMQLTITQPHDLQEVQTRVLLGLHGTVDRTRKQLVSMQPIR